MHAANQCDGQTGEWTSGPRICIHGAFMSDVIACSDRVFDSINEMYVFMCKSEVYARHLVESI